MAPVVFDASRISANTRLRFTFGRSRSDVRWTDKREYTFDDFARLLSTSQVGGKDGTCYVPAIFTGLARKMDQAAQIDVAVLDADCGHSLDEIRSAVAAKGWRAIIHSTHSHMSDRTIIAALAAEKWMRETVGAPIGAYMVEKKGYLPRIMHGAQIIDDVTDGNTRNFVVQHHPCPKFRIILPLSAPWIAEEFESQGIANAKWRERIGALSYALGLHHDQSCVDTSRLFYMPRRRDAAQEYAHVVLAGEDCPLWDLPDAERVPDAPGPSLFDAPPGAAPAFGAAQPHQPQLHVVDARHKTWVDETTGEYVDLTTWAAKYALRFEVVTALRARAPNVFSSRRSNVKHHIICPNSADHVTSGQEGTGTFAVNASQLAAAGLVEIKSGFVIHCMHNGCSNHDRLDHLRALLAQGSLAIADLTDPAFLLPELPRVDASALIKSTATRSLATVADGAAGNIHPELYTDLPGALGLMHRWMVATAPKPQPALALGAALAFCAAAIGQRVQLQHWTTRPNVYVLGVAHSGAGKDRPLSACKQMARAAGLFSELVGVEEVASDSGIVTAVVRAPRQVMLIDEVSFLLNATSSAKSGPHLQNVNSTLLKLYSSSHTTYQSKSYADAEKIKVVDQPCVSFYGSSTPSGLSEALTTKDITSGLLSRMVIFDAGDNDPRKRVPSPDPVPPEIVDWLNAWNRVSPVPNPLHRAGGEAVIQPRIVMMTSEAMEIAEAFDEEMYVAKQNARARGKDALYVRAHENALKFALIRACAIWPIPSDIGLIVDESALKVDASTMRWAVDLSRATVQRMDETTDDIADSAFEAALKALRKFIKRSGENGATTSELARNQAGKHPKRMLEDLFESLAAAKEVYWVTIKTKGRDRNAWVHRDYAAIHGRMEKEESE